MGLRVADETGSRRSSAESVLSLHGINHLHDMVCKCPARPAECARLKNILSHEEEQYRLHGQICHGKHHPRDCALMRDILTGQDRPALAGRPIPGVARRQSQGPNASIEGDREFLDDRELAQNLSARGADAELSESDGAESEMNGEDDRLTPTLGAGPMYRCDSATTLGQLLTPGLIEEAEWSREKICCT